jgi:hypothetical protein
MEKESASLIGSDKVEGTTVYGLDGNSIGTIQRVMIDKISGKVAYAVTSFGGFLGMGEDYYPLPWSQLKYDTDLGGYRANITEAQLKGAPKYSRSTEWDWSDRTNDRKVYDYYQTPSGTPIGPVAGLVGIEGGVVSGVINLESSGVRASDWRPRHDEHYHEV